MRLLSIIVIAQVMLIGFVAAVTNIQLLSDYCAEEARLKKRFDDLVFDRPGRYVTWELFMMERNKRIELSKRFNLSDCVRISQDLKVPTDEDLFEQLCEEERQLELDADACKDETERAEIYTLKEDTKGYRLQVGERLNREECLAKVETETIPVGVGKIPTKLFYERCRQIVFYEHLASILEKVLKKIQNLELVSLAYQADSRLIQAIADNKNYCNGSHLDCYGKQLVEASRLEAPVKAAKMILKAALNSVNLAEDGNNSREKSKVQEKAFESLCLLEHKTGPERQYYQAKRTTLRALNKQIKQYRILLGHVLNKRNCLEESFKSSQVENKGLDEIKVSQGCEDVMKPQLMCQALKRSLASKTSYYNIYFTQVFTFWCDKDKRIQDALNYAEKDHRPHKCTDAMLDSIKRDAEAEAEITLELVDLMKISDEANSSKVGLGNEKKQAYDVVRKVEKIYHKEMEKKAEGSMMREQYRQAYELLAARRHELKAQCGINNSILKKLGWREL